MEQADKSAVGFAPAPILSAAPPVPCAADGTGSPPTTSELGEDKDDDDDASFFLR